MPVPVLLRTAFLSLALVFSLCAGVEASEYLLGPMDKLHIRVAQWQAEKAAAEEWSSISGDYIVGPSGKISIPFVGELQAAGKTTAQLAEAIGDQLQQTLGLISQPYASVELAEFRPIFVSGDVETPGRYAFEPGLTVLKAVSLAGGFRHGQVGLRLERDYINAQGNYAVLAAERNRLIAKRARLKAESAGKSTIEMPEELADDPSGKSLIAEEAAFMSARRKRLEQQLDGIDDLKRLLNNEIVSLERKIATQNRQIKLAQEELEGIGNLQQKGLVVNQRVLTLEQTIADLQGKVLDMETAALRAKQDINEAEREATMLQSDRDNEIAQALQETEAQIEALTLKMDMYKGLMAEAVSRAPAAALIEEEDTTRVEYSIMRDDGRKTAETAADENTPVQPGDVIKVDIVPAPTD